MTPTTTRLTEFSLSYPNLRNLSQTHSDPVHDCETGIAAAVPVQRAPFQLQGPCIHPV